MRSDKRDFNKDAVTWDDNPVRVQLAHDLAEAITTEVALTPNMEVLDFACGTGLVTLEIQPFVQSITGMDSAQGMLDVLAAKVHTLKLNNVKLHLFDLETQNFPPATYDLIVITMALHHVKDPIPLLEHFHRLLKPDGSLCIADLDCEGGLFHDDPTGVFHNGFDREILRHWLADTGFTKTSERTATEIVKPDRDGTPHAFTVFLVTARK